MNNFGSSLGASSLILTIAAFAVLIRTPGSAPIQVRAELNKDLAHILSVNAITPDPELTIEPTTGKSGMVNSPDRKHNAYVLCVPEPTAEDPKRCGHVVHFDDYTGPIATVYQIRGEPELEEVTRPIDNLKWVNNFTLSYERWTGPHFGHRFLIDVRSRKQLAAYDLFG
jgi:hypothetical protein